LRLIAGSGVCASRFLAGGMRGASRDWFSGSRASSPNAGPASLSGMCVLTAGPASPPGLPPERRANLLDAGLASRTLDWPPRQACLVNARPAGPPCLPPGCRACTPCLSPEHWACLLNAWPAYRTLGWFPECWPAPAMNGFTRWVGHMLLFVRGSSETLQYAENFQNHMKNNKSYRQKRNENIFL
jgi:hypothetical protein